MRTTIEIGPKQFIEFDSDTAEGNHPIACFMIDPEGVCFLQTGERIENSLRRLQPQTRRNLFFHMHRLIDELRKQVEP